MSSIFSTQKRQTFLRRKYCFFWVATALSPPVGRCPALPGLPLDSAISLSPVTPLGPVRRASAGRQMAAPEPALEFLNRLRGGVKLEQYVCSFAIFVHAISQPALAPLIHFVHRTAGIG